MRERECERECDREKERDSEEKGIESERKAEKLEKILLKKMEERNCTSLLYQLERYPTR